MHEEHSVYAILTLVILLSWHVIFFQNIFCLKGASVNRYVNHHKGKMRWLIVKQVYLSANISKIVYLLRTMIVEFYDISPVVRRLASLIWLALPPFAPFLLGCTRNWIYYGFPWGLCYAIWFIHICKVKGNMSYIYAK